MWFLEHETLFGGKRVWLRPGSQQLFGRTKSGDDEGKSWKIDNRAVSRKHVVLKIYDVPPESGTKLHTRSQIEVIDLSCRQGTTVDERTTLKSRKLDDGSMEYDKAMLTGTEHTLRLAQGYAPFKIVWQPMVFTYASREYNDSNARSAQLHALDIKTTTDFLFDKTTHVISQKRNVPKVLSGLVAGRHIVTGDFLDAVLRVSAKPVGDADNYEPSKLEEDFDGWWPKEKDYIPPVGAEPVARPQEMLEPDPSRTDIFSGLTFIFLAESQYNSLLEPVTGGGGKGLFFDVKPGVTTIEEYVEYVYSVAGKKKRSNTNGDKLPVLTVRLTGYPDGMEEWATKFVTGVDQALHQRSILQNEFLDAIITKDRASLQRPPAESVNMPSSRPAPTQLPVREPTPMSQARNLSPGKSASPEHMEPVKTGSRKRIHRPRAGGRFTGFDDFEPPTKRTKIDDTSMPDVQESVQSSVTPATCSQSPVARVQHTHRPAVDDVVAKEEQLDTLFPAAAAIKRQRAAARGPSASVESEASGPVQPAIGKGKETIQKLQRAQAKAASREFNVLERARIRVKEEEERRRADEESLAEALDGFDMAQIRNMTEIEEMELRPRANKAAAYHPNATSDRWNPDWNGRKNFKKFRRRGVERGIQTHRTIIRLEEAPLKKGLGVADTFLVDDIEASSTFRSHKSRNPHHANDNESSDPEVGGFVSRRRWQHTPVVHVEDSADDDDDQGPSVRTQRVDETQVDETQTQTQTLARGKKRGASTVAGSSTSKRSRVGMRDDDSDEEEMGFRFKRRA